MYGTLSVGIYADECHDALESARDKWYGDAAPVANTLAAVRVSRDEDGTCFELVHREHLGNPSSATLCFATFSGDVRFGDLSDAQQWRVANQFSNRIVELNLDD